VFGWTAGDPFVPSTVRRRALKAWEAAKLRAITPHECRHTYVSTVLASRVDVKAVSVWTGHSSTSTTTDRYGHIMPGAEAEAARKMQAYLDAARKPA
jgi:integrase